MHIRLRHPKMARTRPFFGPLRLSLIFALCSFVDSLAQADGQMRAVLPPTYGYLTIAASGHTFKFLSTAPVFGEGGKRLALGLAYINEGGDDESLHDSASELFEYLRPRAEAQNEQTVVIIAYTSFDVTKAMNASPTFHIVYERGPSGKWKQLPSATPRTELATNDSISSQMGLNRDLSAEKEALADAQAWLSLLEAGNYTRAWEVASPLLRGLDSKERWETGSRATAGTLGRLLSRKKRSTLSTRFVPGAPTGSYVVFEFLSHFSIKGLAFERVAEVLCDDGKWRVAGYHVQYP